MAAHVQIRALLSVWQIKIGSLSNFACKWPDMLIGITPPPLSYCVWVRL